MTIFSKDTEIVRLSPDMIALYSDFLLKVGKSKCTAYSIISPVEDFSCSPRSTLICHEVPSTFRVHQPEQFGYISC